MAPGASVVSPEVAYVALLFALFVVPRLLLRWRIPTAITSLALGAGAGLGLGLFAADATVGLLSTLGIVSLFLLAGLHVDLADLRREARFLGAHVGVQVLTILVLTAAAARTLGLDTRAALITGLALATPSTGFILDSLGGLALAERERFWVKSKAIATEIVALGVLFVVLQSTTARQLGISALVLAGLVGLLPLAFRAFAAVVVPWAPRSEFAFLVMVAVVAAFVTRQIGVYYLVGAFVVGVTAQRFRTTLPALTSERMLHAIEAFASLFVPFYFFHAGLEIPREALSLASLVTGLAFVAVAVPLRIYAVAIHRRAALGERFRESLRVSTPLVPTLVFTLVLAGILRDRFDAPDHLLGGLVVYTVLNTLLPGIVLGAPSPELDAMASFAPSARRAPAPD